MSPPLVILGAGVSGLAAARLAASEGQGGVLVSEQAPGSDDLKTLTACGFRWQASLPETGSVEVILSPGIPSSHPWLIPLRKQNARILPEFEWAASRLSGRQMAVTGSLGKTSMVLLAAELLRAEGYQVTVSGNIGTAVSEMALTRPVADIHLLELSSFQLESTGAYRPNIGICLNLLPNHLDRHQDLRAYAQAKARLFKFQTADDLAVWPAEFPGEVLCAARRVDAQSVELPDLAGSPFSQGPLRRNLQFLIAGLSGITEGMPSDLDTRVRNFVFPAHRMQWLSIPGAGPVMDDSKSTCLSATRAALEMVEGPVQLVMGGLDKAEDLQLLTPLFAQRKPALYLFGHAAKIMGQAWQDSVDECLTFDTLEGVLPVLWSGRSAVQTLIFSPGCASFDQYPGYAARGQHFQHLVTRQARSAPIQ